MRLSKHPAQHTNAQAHLSLLCCLAQHSLAVPTLLSTRFGGCPYLLLIALLQHLKVPISMFSNIYNTYFRAAE